MGTPQGGEFLSSNQNLPSPPGIDASLRHLRQSGQPSVLGIIKECVTTNRLTFQTNSQMCFPSMFGKHRTRQSRVQAVFVWNRLSYTGVPRLSSSRLFAPCLAVPQQSLTGSGQRTHLATESASIKHQRRNFTKFRLAVKQLFAFSRTYAKMQKAGRLEPHRLS